VFSLYQTVPFARLSYMGVYPPYPRGNGLEAWVGSAPNHNVSVRRRVSALWR